MGELRQAATGILGAMLSAIVVLGSITLALAEGGIPAAQAPAQPAVTQFVFPTPRPGQPTYTASPTVLPTATETPPASAFCPPPAGWITIVTAPGETLADIAAQYGVNVAALMQANCLISDKLAQDGVVLSVPNLPPTATQTLLPTATRTPRPAAQESACKTDIPGSWILYTVRRGDTLTSIAYARYTTWQDLYRRNCLTTTTIVTGQRFYVPGVATRTPTAIPTLPPTATPVVIPSITPTRIPSPTPTSTSAPGATPTNTAVPSPTHTPTHTPEPPTDTPQPTDTPVPTNTPTPQEPASPTPPDESARPRRMA